MPPTATTSPNDWDPRTLASVGNIDLRARMLVGVQAGTVPVLLLGIER